MGRGGRGVRQFGSVQEAVDAGYVVMNLRTIEYPDGRRVQILTRPDPRARPVPY
jgi:hypothetical protein